MNTAQEESFYLNTIDSIYKFTPTHSNEVEDILDLAHEKSIIKNISFYKNIIRVTESHKFAKEPVFQEKKELIIGICKNKIVEIKNERESKDLDLINKRRINKIFWWTFWVGIVGGVSGLISLIIKLKSEV